jgi:hypothetical protein
MSRHHLLPPRTALVTTTPNLRDCAEVSQASQADPLRQCRVAKSKIESTQSRQAVSNGSKIDARTGATNSRR